jgi:hypothetical protein
MKTEIQRALFAGFLGALWASAACSSSSAPAANGAAPDAAPVQGTDASALDAATDTDGGAPGTPPAATDGGADATLSDASPPPGPGARQLDIPPRDQWNNANGYCGETSIQSIALYYGAWVSENVVRTIAGGEVLLGTNATKPLDALHFTYTAWDSDAATPQFDAFLLWMTTNLAQGTPPFFAVYLTDGTNDPDYDHIVPAVGVTYASLTAYAGTDVLAYNDNFGGRITRAFSTLSATRSSCASSSTQGGCIPTDVDYGIAVTGIVDPGHATLPVSLSVAQSSEPNVSLDASAVPMTATVTVSGLTAGKAYALLRYDDYTQVPTSGAAADFLASSYTHRIDFTATGPGWTQADPTPFTSSGASVYRAVAR